MEPFIGGMESAFNSIATFRSFARMGTLDGREIAVLFTRSATTALSSAGHVLLAIVDMTDKVEAQKALAEMQSNFAHAARVSSLGELTASIAHEVNQPLTAITAYGEAALLWLGHNEPDLDHMQDDRRVPRRWNYGRKPPHTGRSLHRAPPRWPFGTPETWLINIRGSRPFDTSRPFDAKVQFPLGHR